MESVVVAPAWADTLTATSTESPHTNHGRGGTNALPDGGKNGLDICRPALAASITRDAERLCSQQRERTSQAMETALAEVNKAERAAHAETVKHQLNDNNGGEASVWVPHTQTKQPSGHRKAKVGRAAGLPSTPNWAQEFHEMKRRVSWATALDSTIDDERSAFPRGAPLRPPPPLAARKGSIVSAVLALADSPPSPPLTSPEGKSRDSEKGPVVIDDDWVVRKLAQIRRRSRNVDSAISLPGMHVHDAPTTTRATSIASAIADPTQQTLQPLLRREIPGKDSHGAEHDDQRPSPLPRVGEDAFILPAPETSRGQRQDRSNETERSSSSNDGTVGQGSLPATRSSSFDNLRDERVSRHGNEVPTRDDGDDGDDGGSVIAAVSEDGRGRQSGELTPTDAHRTSREAEEGRQRLHDVTPEERAMSLPSSSVLAADGSGELGLNGRSVRWGVGRQVGHVQGRPERETVWSKRRKQKEAEAVAAKEEARRAKEKRAQMVLEVLARSEEIFRSNAEKRRRRSADDSNATRTPGLQPTGKAAPPRVARGGAVTIGGGGRPTTSPVVLNDSGGDSDKHHGHPRRKLSAYIRGMKESSPPALDGNSNSENRSRAEEGAARDEDKAVVDTATAMESAPAVVQGSERRHSAVTLAAKRVAMRRRKNRAAEDARMREEAVKREARRAFEGSLRAIVATSATRTGGVSAGGRKAVRQRRSSAPSCSSSVPSARPSGLSLGSPEGEESKPSQGVAISAKDGVAGNTNDVRVSVRVPMASQEDAQGAASRVSAQEPTDNLLDPLSPRSARKVRVVEAPSAPAAVTVDKTTEQRLRGRRQRRRREKEEEEERTSCLLEELSRKRQESIAASEARRRHEASERRRSARQMELERRRQLEQLEEISRQDARLSASARSMARQRVKAAKLEAEAAKTAAANEHSASAAVAGGEEPGVSTASRRHRKRSSLGVRDLNDASIDRLTRRHQRINPQDCRGDATDDGVVGTNPRIRRNSSPANSRVHAATQRQTTDGGPGDGRAGVMTPFVNNDRSGGYSAHGNGHKQVSRRLGLTERRRRRRKRQQRSSSRQKKPCPPRRPDPLDNNDDDVDDNIDDADDDSDGVADDSATAIASKRHPSDFGHRPGHCGETGTNNRSSRDNHAVSVDRDDNTCRDRATPAKHYSHPQDGEAQEKLAEVRRDGKVRDGNTQEITFKPVAEPGYTKPNSRRNHPGVETATDVLTTSAPRTEEKPRTRRLREVPEHLQAGEGRRGAEEKEVLRRCESRAATTTESRLRRRSKRQASCSKKRGETVAVAGATDHAPPMMEPAHEGIDVYTAPKDPEEEPTPAATLAKNVCVQRGRGRDRNASGEEGGNRSGDEDATDFLRGNQADDRAEDEESAIGQLTHRYTATPPRSGQGATADGARTGTGNDIEGMTNTLHRVSVSGRSRPPRRERVWSIDQEGLDVDGDVDVDVDESLHQRSSRGVEAEREGQEVQVLKRGGGGGVDYDGACFAPSPVSADRGTTLGGDEQVMGGEDAGGRNSFSCINPILHRISEEEHGEEGEDDEDGADDLVEEPEQKD